SLFINWFCKWIGKKKLSKAYLEGPAFKVVRPFHDNNISLQFQMEECHLLLTNQVDLANLEGHRIVPDVRKPFPLGVPPGQVTTQSQHFFNKDLEYLVSGDKGKRSALSISKLKAAHYLVFGLEELVSSFWIESEHEYNISAAYETHDDQDPPPPLPDLDPSKKRRHDLGASWSTQPLAPQSSSWKMSDTRETPSISSRRKSASHPEQPIKNVPIKDNVNVSDSEDTDTAHIPKLKTRPDWMKPVLEKDGPATSEPDWIIPPNKPDWMKPVLEKDGPATSEPDWIIPPNKLPEPENNWANALASSYQDPEEYMLLRQTGDMSLFINWMRIEELGAVLTMKHPNHVFSSYLDLNLVEVEEGLDRHGSLA
nr:hypothetical protein [Tanacetum cinerariifolium]